MAASSYEALTNGINSVLSRAHGKRGFSLVELLVVMAIMALLLGVSGPALGALRKAGTVNRIAQDLSLQLEQARAHAMANNTYVWVGFNANAAQDSLTVAIVAGKTGTVSDLALPATYAPLAKIRSYDHVGLKVVDQLAVFSKLAGLAVASDVSGSVIGTFVQNNGPTPLTFTNVIQFSPTGETSINPADLSHWIQFGIQSTQGNAASNQDGVAFQLAGLTGQVRVFRP